ncbi:hypothetical protein RRF57_001975 [Xylaria bambusicola]|uniref:Carrier domain-containing protein n=1 Tax=Xylaria bambusicola TaxID=326684 RepID=A0AAN7U695_9PEZI
MVISLVALHLACQDLRTRNSDMALVGGANLVYHPNFMKTMSDFNFLSPDSQCWSFDERANGYARGEGVAIMVVKRLDDALRDHDTIRAIIRNTGSNQDGQTPGITQPSEQAQVDLIRNTYQNGNIEMEPTRFFQAHATGTAVGDPIEGNAIGRAFQGYRSRSDPLHIGAVKANIGHLEGCSGLAGVIITILVLERGVIPPISGLKLVNKRIDPERLHLHVNSFGFGGTNAVAILDDAYSYLNLNGLRGFHRTIRAGFQIGNSHPLADRGSPITASQALDISEPPERGEQNTQFQNEAKSAEIDTARVLVLSAPEKSGLERSIDLYHEYLLTRPDNFEIDNLVNAMVTKRSHFSWRSFAIANSAHPNPSTHAIMFSRPVKTSKSPRVAFIFTGQGAQYLGMGKELMSFPAFRDSIATYEESLGKLGCKWSPLAILDGTADEPDPNTPEISQPITTILQVALVDFLESLGIVASLVVGHSSGEIAGAYASGALSRDAAIEVAYYRGILSSQLASTRTDLAMMAVGLSRHEVMTYLPKLRISEEEVDVEVGCINSPRSITLTGNHNQLLILEEYLKSDGVFTRMLRVPMAYHSRHMRSIGEQYANSLRILKHEKTVLAHTPMISSVSGDVIAAEDLATAQYWVRNLISPVEFELSFTRLLSYSARVPRKQLGKQTAINIQGVTHVLEVGPHGALQGPIREMIANHAGVKPHYMTTLTRGHSASLSMLKLSGTLYCAGFPINLLRINGLGTSPRPTPPEMPPYPFSRLQRHWIESFQSHNFRFRDTARHELLGTRSNDWNPGMAIWRNVIRLGELLWLEDHKIGGLVVLPAAAILVMAIEAFRQLYDSSKTLHGIYMNNITFLHAVSFPPGATKMEIQFALMPSSYSANLSPSSEFRLFSLENGSYLECARGFLQGITNEVDKLATALSGPWAPTKTFNTWTQNIESSCAKHIESPYRAFEGTELQYGPSFQNLSSVKVGPGGELSASVDTNRWKVKKSDWPPTPFMIHPATLDGIFQSGLHSYLAQHPDSLSTMMPVQVGGLYIDSRVVELSDNVVAIRARPNLYAKRRNSVDISSTGTLASLPLIYVTGLETASISGVQSSNMTSNKPRRICTRLEWKADIDTMTRSEILRHCTYGRPNQPLNAIATYRLQKVAIMCFVEEALSFLDDNPNLELKGHLKSYVEWMRYQQSLITQSDPESLLLRTSISKLLADPTERESVNHEVTHAPGDGFFFVEIGKSLLAILRGEIDPLDIMFRNGLADKYYKEMLGNEHHTFPVVQFLDLLCFKNPSMRILEVGAGTGGQTMRVLDSMHQKGVKKWEHYDYTDISPGFFGTAKKKFSSYLGNMSFRVCDISKDPGSQGYAEYSYDLIIASHVLHATNSLRDSLRNIRRLLKSGGKLLLFETTRPEAIPVGFAFGVLDGWWEPLHYETRSTHSPCVTVDRWDTLLKEEAFTGVDVNIPGQQEPYCQTASIIISTAVCNVSEAAGPARHVYVVMNDRVQAQIRAAALLQSSMQEKMAVTVVTGTLADLVNRKASKPNLVIFLSEIDAVLLDDISPGDYVLLQTALMATKDILWVTRTEPQDDARPKHQLSAGLGRSLMSEDSTLNFVHLNLTHSECALEDEVQYIHELADKIVNLHAETIDNDYVVLENKLHICRLTEYEQMDAKIAQTTSPYQHQDIQLTDETRLELCPFPANKSSAGWRELDRHEDNSGASSIPGTATIQVQAIGLSFQDYLVANNHLKAKVFGAECAGVVLECSSESEVKKGDRVCFISSTNACSILDVQEQALIKIPGAVTFASAASMCTAQWIAYYALVKLARLQQGEVVLIHQGSSCVGQMAIQLARSLCSQVFVTVGSQSKANFLQNEMSIPEDHIFQIGDPTISQHIYDATNQHGVDVAVGAFGDSAKDHRTDFVACLAHCGRLVDTSIGASYATMPPMRSNRPSHNSSISTVNMMQLMQERPDLFYATFRGVRWDSLLTDV